MYQRSRARALFVGLIVTAVALVTLDLRDVDRTDGVGIVDRARGIATSVVRPLQDGVTAVVRPFVSIPSAARDLFATRAENQRLRDEVSALRERRRAAVELERENDELRALLGLRIESGYDTVAARTIALAPSNFEWTITIDVGSEDGVERGMPVVNGDGLVGRVLLVTPTASRVLLLVDPNFSVAARGARAGTVGTLDGRGSDPMVFRPLDPRSELAVGAEVVTASYLGGGFPSGIPIGVIGEVGAVGSRLSREFRVLPYVDFSRLNHLLVVRSWPVEDVPRLDGSVGVPFTRPPIGDPEVDGGDVSDDADAGTAP